MIEETGIWIHRSQSQVSHEIDDQRPAYTGLFLMVTSLFSWLVIHLGGPMVAVNLHS